MNKQDCLAVGEVVKTHGIHGELVIELYSTEWLKNIEEPVFLEIDGLPVPFFISQISSQSNERVRIKFDWVDNETQATKLVKTTVLIPSAKASISKNTVQNNLDTLIGFQAFDLNLGPLGSVIAIISDINNPLAVIAFNGNELLIPLHPDLIHAIDTKHKTITFVCPEGLIEMYR